MDFIIGALVAVLVIIIIGTYRKNVTNRINDLSEQVQDLNELVSHIVGGDE